MKSEEDIATDSTTRLVQIRYFRVGIKMKKVFIIDIEGGISEAELFGCLEDTIGDEVISVTDIDMPFCYKCGTIKHVACSETTGKPTCLSCKYKLSGGFKPSEHRLQEVKKLTIHKH